MLLPDVVQFSTSTRLPGRLPLNFLVQRSNYPVACAGVQRTTPCEHTATERGGKGQAWSPPANCYWWRFILAAQRGRMADAPSAWTTAGRGCSAVPMQTGVLSTFTAEGSSYHLFCAPVPGVMRQHNRVMCGNNDVSLRSPIGTLKITPLQSHPWAL